MRRKIARQTTAPELITAIGLVWGHLNASQFEEAFQLAKACLRIWPGNKNLAMMYAYAAVELLEPLDERTVAMMHAAGCSEWTEIVLRRAEMHSDAHDETNGEAPATA
ncbi:MAG TPA: hypothetical protein VJ654_03340 [Noviherbaspirillum sp.]|nr:hypothetical protein [Noviherbaspirillum sp.]